MAKTGHKSLRSIQRYVKPGLAAVHQAPKPCPHPGAADDGTAQPTAHKSVTSTNPG
ncbi:hypothetical protein [Saccharothrix obliqua]|uniref:hypothetical protein n=1 Tax=Saccharothrix obliqua TaxID=2861747 RepID=UPI001C5F672B|nr:hypothetical protein [Saccharothrix obliqua]MBW4722427.1 hypothetical protein [Saccharothrix obliqua]